MPGRYILCNKGGKKVTRHLPATRVNHTDPVTIAIKSDAKMRLPAFDLGAQDFQCFGIDGVWVVVRKRAVNLGKQHMMLAFNPASHLGGDVASGTVATVPDHSHASGLHACRDAIDVAGLDRHILAAAAGNMADTLCAGVAKQDDIFTEERCTPHHHLKAIMLWWVVASCNLNGTIGLHVMCGKI